MKDPTLYYIRKSTRDVCKEAIEALVLDYYATLSSGVRTYSKEQLAEEADELMGKIVYLCNRDIELARDYFGEWEVIDGIKQHKRGLSFEQYAGYRDAEGYAETKDEEAKRLFLID